MTELNTQIELIVSEIIGATRKSKTLEDLGQANTNGINDITKLVKKLSLSGVMPSLSQEIECVCGWEGKKGNLYYRERNKKLNIGAKLECPKCYTDLVSEPN